MASIFTFLTFIALLSSAASAFSGNFELTNVVVSSPFQADPTSTQSTYVQFDFCDEDTPEVGSTHCCVEWAVGLSPPTSAANTCDNSTFDVLVTSWQGVGNLSLRLAHQYIDDRYVQAKLSSAFHSQATVLTQTTALVKLRTMCSPSSPTSTSRILLPKITNAIWEMQHVYPVTAQ
ncbi:hypothetical protein CLAIMM_09334 isoform 3 [Cladophialophora immunda]|nr:hypothetical protein CLAIMM_09334 isoform 3 [Cladophialophora immunda]